MQQQQKVKVTYSEWLTDFFKESQRLGIKYDAAHIVEAMFKDGISPREAAEKLQASTRSKYPQLS